MDDGTDWRPTEYPGYLVNGLGQVRGPRGRVLRERIRGKGYPAVIVTGDRPQYIHYLVCVAFHGPTPAPAYEVAHGNGNPKDNRSSNLRWATPAENAADGVAHGTRRAFPQRGARNGRAKLTRSQVDDLRALAHTGVPQKRLAIQFGISKSQVHNIVHRLAWT